MERAFCRSIFAMLSSEKAENRINDISKALDKRSCGAIHRKESIIKASVVVELRSGLPVRIVFVRNRQKRGWLALLSTDLELSPEEIVQTYGKRWDIEVFFKMAKHYLKLEKEMQMRDYDGLVSHTTIVMIRYLFLSF